LRAVAALRRRPARGGARAYNVVFKLCL
jgi:hypothetical protein